VWSPCLKYLERDQEKTKISERLVFGFSALSVSALSARHRALSIKHSRVVHSVPLLARLQHDRVMVVRRASALPKVLVAYSVPQCWEKKGTGFVASPLGASLKGGSVGREAATWAKVIQVPDGTSCSLLVGVGRNRRAKMLDYVV
jgi:hypothetical protein